MTARVLETTELAPSRTEASEPVPDRVLVARARRNPSGPAFAELVRRHQGRVRGLLLRLSRNPTTADDLAQEAFVRAFRGIVAFEGRSSFSTWIYRIAYNIFLNHRARTRAHRPLPAVEERPMSGAPHDESPGRTDLRKDLAAAVDTLPDHYRDVVVLYYLRQVTYPEIAQILDMPLGTVKTHLHRARAMLRTQMTGWVATGGAS